MSISVPCSCGKKLAAPDNLAGKKAKCPGCGKVLQIPAAGGVGRAATPSATSSAKPAAPPRSTAAPAPPPAIDLDVPAGLAADEPAEYDLDLPDDLATSKPAAAAPQRASAQPETETDKPHVPPAAASRKCPACKEPMGAKDITCKLCGFSPGTGNYVGSAQRYATHEKTRSFGSLFGIDLNVYTLSVLGVLFCCAAALLVWFFTGPGAKFQVIEVQTADRVLAVASANFEPEFHPGPGVITKRADPDLLPDGIKGEYCMGGTEQIVITRPNPKGDWVVAHVALSQGLMRGLKQEAGYNVTFLETSFKILGGPTPISPTLVAMSLNDPEKKTQPSLNMSFAQAGTADPNFLVPAGYKPSHEDFKRDDRNQITGGKMDFDAKSGLSGTISFRSYHSRADDQFGTDSISATGLLKAVDPKGVSLDYSYNGYAMGLTWTGGNAWFTKGNYRKPQLPTDYHKFDLTLIFPRPKGVDRVTVQLAGLDIGSLNIAGAAKRSEPPPDLNKPSGEPLTDYLGALVKARKKAMGVISDSNLRQIRIVLMDYVEKNHGLWPERLEDVPELERNLVNPKTGEKLGYIYVMPAANDRDIKSPEKTIVVYEAEGGKPMPGGDVLFADGSIGKATGN
ncbi:MAG: hypothetical protein NTW19_04990 [Planctomycetota bacterium]|nr:hypothetical protein [Planctomycetota bacterium]